MGTEDPEIDVLEQQLAVEEDSDDDEETQAGRGSGDPPLESDPADAWDQRQEVRLPHEPE